MTNAPQGKMRTAEPASQSEVLIVRSEKIEGKNKNNAVLEHGAYLRSDSSPCKPDCPKRKVGCKKDCKEREEWEKVHLLAKKEYADVVRSQNQAKWQHTQIMQTVMGNKHRSRRK